jgi:hypothetical protein
MAPTVFTYCNPMIEYISAGIIFSAKCNDESTFIFKNRIMSIDRRDQEILIFLTENQIVQLVDLYSVRDTYDCIIKWLSAQP